MGGGPTTAKANFRPDADRGDPLRAGFARCARRARTARGVGQAAPERVQRVEAMDVKSAAWLQPLKKIRAALKGHIHEEEHDIWPRIREAWDGERLGQAGREMARVKHRKRGERATARAGRA